MSILKELQQIGTRKVPQLKTGQTVHVHQLIQEGDKKRTQIFEGLIIKINSGTGVDKSFTVRKIVEGIGVERTFPLHSPLIKKIVVKKEAKVRRSKLYYMRDRFGKSARLKEFFVGEEKPEVAEEKVETPQTEEVAEEKVETPQTEEVAEEKVETPQTEEVAEEKVETPQTEEVAEEKVETPQTEEVAEEKVEKAEDPAEKTEEKA